MKSWIQKKDNNSLIKIYVLPNSSKNEFVGEYGNPVRLKLKVKAAAVDGAANKELIKFISKSLRIPKNEIDIFNGLTSRNKDLLVKLEATELERRINSILQK